MSHLIHNYSDVSPIERSRGGLAAWQERIAKEILIARIAILRTVDELGQACGVSARHFHAGFPEVHRRTAAPMAQAGAGPSTPRTSSSIQTERLPNFGDMRLRQSEPLLPRFPSVLWAEPIDGKAAGEGERRESLTDRQGEAQAGHALWHRSLVPQIGTGTRTNGRGAADAFSRKPLSRASHPFIRPTLKGCKGSI